MKKPGAALVTRRPAKLAFDPAGGVLQCAQYDGANEQERRQDHHNVERSSKAHGLHSVSDVLDQI